MPLLLEFLQTWNQFCMWLDRLNGPAQLLVETTDFSILSQSLPSHFHAVPHLRVSSSIALTLLSSLLSNGYHMGSARPRQRWSGFITPGVIAHGTRSLTLGCHAPIGFSARKWKVAKQNCEIHCYTWSTSSFIECHRLHFILGSHWSPLGIIVTAAFQL